MVQNSKYTKNIYIKKLTSYLCSLAIGFSFLGATNVFHFLAMLLEVCSKYADVLLSNSFRF